MTHLRFWARLRDGDDGRGQAGQVPQQERHAQFLQVVFKVARALIVELPLDGSDASSGTAGVQPARDPIGVLLACHGHERHGEDEPGNHVAQRSDGRA